MKSSHNFSATKENSNVIQPLLTYGFTLNVHSGMNDKNNVAEYLQEVEWVTNP